tara:strand:- start:1171 stop:1389 length:219 start_codon:yes stop_codon:yes gene_type:complete
MSIKEHEYNEEWCCHVELGIYDVKNLYNVICYALETWPGSPARPAEEQEYLRYMKQSLFSMLADYTFTHIEQ